MTHALAGSYASAPGHPACIPDAPIIPRKPYKSELLPRADYSRGFPGPFTDVAFGESLTLRKVHNCKRNSTDACNVDSLALSE